MSGRVDNQDVGLEAATIERVRNSSLVERDPAPTTYRGSSLVPKLRNWSDEDRLVGERSGSSEGQP
jgi:hypothetical protein